MIRHDKPFWLCQQTTHLSTRIRHMQMHDIKLISSQKKHQGKIKRMPETQQVSKTNQFYAMKVLNRILIRRNNTRDINASLNQTGTQITHVRFNTTLDWRKILAHLQNFHSPKPFRIP